MKYIPQSKYLTDSFSDSLASLQEIPNKIAIGVSGGTDSSMLAVVAKNVTEKLGIDIIIFHINHALQTVSDDWSEKVRELAAFLDVKFYDKKVVVDLISKNGIEGAARIARYRAFGELSKNHGIKYIFLAHHLNDQAETLLLRLFRGSGVKGMTGMSVKSEFNGISYIRPWLNIDKKIISEESNKFSLFSSWSPINDPTNNDPAYSRGVLRIFLEPVLDKYWPQWKNMLYRYSAHMVDANNIISDIAEEYLNSLDFDSDKLSFSLLKWRLLKSKSIKLHVLRKWIMLNNLKMPSQASLDNIYRQLSQLHALGHDRSMKIFHDNRFILCKYGRVYVKM